jgi:hypothetical protein
MDVTWRCDNLITTALIALLSCIFHHFPVTVRAAAMNAFEKLPSELLLKIAFHLGDVRREDSRQLRNLALVSRELRGIAQAALYHSPYINLGSLGRSSRPLQITQFLRTLIDPDSHVHLVEYVVWISA